MPTYVYIDEAADYFDNNIGIILSQARKYKMGMVLAHQFLGQMDHKLQEGVFTNTSIRFAGGVSSKDARALANEMRTDASFIEGQDKLSLASFVRGTTQQSVSISIKPGQMENLSKLDAAQKQKQRDHMRQKFCVHYSETQEKKMNESQTDENAETNEELATPKLFDQPDSW